MRRWIAVVLAVLLILGGCAAQDAPSTPSEPAQAEPVQAGPAGAASDAAPDDSSEDVTAETPLAADDLPESCRAYFDTAARCGPAEAVAGTHAAANASDGVSQVYGVHLPDGEFADLRQSAGADGVTVEEFSNGGAVRESAASQLAWDGETYHALTISAENCAVPNIAPASGGILRLNITGDCAVVTAPELGIFEGFDCVLVTGTGTLRLDDLTCGGGALGLPALIVDGDVTLICNSVTLTRNAEQPLTLVQRGGTLLTERFQTDGTALLAGGVLLARGMAAEELYLCGGTALIDWVDSENTTITLAGGAGYFACELPAGTHIEGGAGTLTAQSLSQATVTEYAASVTAGDDAQSFYYQTAFSPDWLPEGTAGAAWDSLTLSETGAGYFAGTLRLENAQLESLIPWGALHAELAGESIVDGDLGGTGLLADGDGALSVQTLGLYGWGGLSGALIVAEAARIAAETVQLDSASGGEAAVTIAGELTCAGEVWMKNAALTVGGTLRADGPVSIERGRVEITGGTVYLAEGLWLGEGDVVVSGGEVIVPGGADAICCDNGNLLVTGGTVREP